MTTRSTRPTPRRTPPPRVLVALLAVLLVPWAAARDGEAPALGDAARGGIRFANLVPEGTTIDVRIDGEASVEALAPSTVSRYVFLAPGEHTIEVTARATLGGGGNVGAEDVDVDPDPPAAEAAAPEGAEPTQDVDPDDLRDTVLLERTVEVRAEAYATLLLFRTPASESPAAADDAAAAEPPADGDETPEATEEPTASDAAAEGDAADAPADGAAGERTGPPPLDGRMVEDPLEALPAAGTALVRVVHAAPGIGPVTVVAARGTSEDDPPSAEGEATEDGADAANAEGADAPAEAGADAAPDAAGEGDEAARADPSEGPAPIEGEALASGLGPDDGSGYAVVSAGPHHVQVRVEDGVVAVDLDEVVFQAGLVYTLYVAATDASDVVVVTPAVDAGVSFEAR